MLKDKIRIDLNKNTKLNYYISNMLKMLIPSIYFQKRLEPLLKDKEITDKDILERVNYYNKIESSFFVNEDIPSITEFKKEKKKTYYFDLIEFLRYFNPKFKISYLFGDIVDVPVVPTVLKSRPIEGDNKNSIVMKLNKVRHFIFVNDKKPFEEKKDMLVWRGKCYVEHRKKFIREFYDKSFCNVGQTNTKGEVSQPWQKSKMQLEEQLQYKFILAIEGNDVASNLKWVMSSNSIAFMPKPKYETWFMEGRLVANYHYVLLKDDYSDLEEKVEYYSKNIEESLQIIKNANKYVSQFKDTKRENLISLLVLKKYFEKSNQLSRDF